MQITISEEKPLENEEQLAQFLDMLINHFNYSIKDINSWDELTNEEKQIIDRELFNQVTS